MITDNVRQVVLKYFAIIIYIILTISLRARYYYYSHLMTEETEAQRG